MINRFSNPRFFACLLFLASVVGMTYALYLQHILNLEPCPLCIFQRIGLVIMGIFSLAFFVIHPKKLWAKLMLWLGSTLGIAWSIAIAARHVWLQHLPPEQVPACGPGLNYWMETLPLLQVFEAVLSGSGECASIDWTLVGLSIPEQSLIFFIVLGMMHGWWCLNIFKQMRRF